MSPTNLEIAELLACGAERAEGHWGRALRKASRAALMWPEEARALVDEGGSLTDLWRVGPKIAGLMTRWFEDPPEIPEPPPQRQDFQTFAHARAVVADHPEWKAELLGDLQMHSVYSDGGVTLEELAAAGAALGYEYVGVTDHSKDLKIAGGMDEATLARQIDEIDRLNSDLARRGVDFEVLRGLEMNLRPDGSGDMDPQVLAELDLVLGSFHSQLRKEEDQTERYLAALDNPDIQVLGHPRGRQYNFRLGLQADWDVVFERAVRRGIALEIDCHPNRQDLNVELLIEANRAGATFSIGTDAHAPWELDFIEIGLASAIAAGIPQDRVLNFAPADGVRRWARGVRALRVRS